MTGIAWVDIPVFTVFVAVTMLTLVRLGRSRGLDHFLDGAFHAVMGLAMTAMFWPSAAQSPTPTWIAIIGLIVLWPILVLTLAARRSAVVSGQVPAGRAALGQLSLGHAGYWLTGVLLMVVAVGAGHDRSLGTSPAAVGGHGSGHPVTQSVEPSMLGNTLQVVAGWPVWPLIGVGFGVYAGLLVLGPRLLPGPRRPITERVCAAVMAAGMAGMAFAL
jgi:hypothetical protein